jgi:hypothetical protein
LETDTSTSGLAKNTEEKHSIALSNPVGKEGSVAIDSVRIIRVRLMTRPGSVIRFMCDEI